MLHLHTHTCLYWILHRCVFLSLFFFLTYIGVYFFLFFKKEAVDTSTAYCNCLLICPCLLHLSAVEPGMVTAFWPFHSFTGWRGSWLLVPQSSFTLHCLVVGLQTYLCLLCLLFNRTMVILLGRVKSGSSHESHMLSSSQSSPAAQPIWWHSPHPTGKGWWVNDVPTANCGTQSDLYLYPQVSCSLELADPKLMDPGSSNSQLLQPVVKWREMPPLSGVLSHSTSILCVWRLCSLVGEFLEALASCDHHWRENPHLCRADGHGVMSSSCRSFWPRNSGWGLASFTPTSYPESCSCGKTAEHKPFAYFHYSNDVLQLKPTPNTAPFRIIFLK